MMRYLVLFVLLLGTVARADDKSDRADKADKADKKKADKDSGRPKMIAERVVAIVNDAVILESELEARMMPLMQEVNQITDPAERERRRSKLKGQVLDDMVSEELIVQAGEQAKIEVESSEVQAALDEIKTQNKLDDAGLQQLLAQQGFTLSNYKADLRRQIMRLRAINQLVSPKVNITDDQVQSRYDELQRRSEGVSDVRLAHIQIKLPEHPTEQDQNAAKQRAADALARIRAGEDFAAVCAEVSDDTSTAKSGGELGWFQRGSLSDPTWESVVFSMEKDDVRGPVGGQAGYHIFKALETKNHAHARFARDEGTDPGRVASQGDRPPDHPVHRRAAQEGLHRPQAAGVTRPPAGRSVRCIVPDRIHHSPVDPRTMTVRGIRDRQSPYRDTPCGVAACQADDRGCTDRVYRAEPIAGRGARVVGAEAADGCPGPHHVFDPHGRAAGRRRRDGSLGGHRRRRRTIRRPAGARRMGPQQVLRAAAVCLVALCGSAVAAPAAKLHEKVAIIDLGPAGDSARKQIAVAILDAGLDPVIGDGVDDALAGSAPAPDALALAGAIGERRAGVRRARLQGPRPSPRGSGDPARRRTPGRRARGARAREGVQLRAGVRGPRGRRRRGDARGVAAARARRDRSADDEVSRRSTRDRRPRRRSISRSTHDVLKAPTCGSITSAPEPPRSLSRCPRART